MSKFFALLLLFLGCFALEAQTHVLVSIAPQKFLVESIGQDKVFVEVIVPPGASSHSYEPSPRQMISTQKGKIWFRLGESFEKRLAAALKSTTRIVDQREGLDLLSGGCGCCLGHDAHDPHIWLSPKLLKIQALQIERELSLLDPEHQNLFQRNAQQLLEALNQLDDECSQLASQASNKLIMVSHPAFGYFCRDYGYEQLPIEMEGREPSPRYLSDLLFIAKAHKIQTIFLQQQHNPRGGTRVAKELGAKTVYIDPYAENVIENLKKIAYQFAAS